ncbi:TIGR01212 family radical SAM protein [Deferribacteraceae bacterium V6Fe1]|nr:TIGR01212 family radical SAM protein [Deferribacteraceae bacterium V6Fe1]
MRYYSLNNYYRNRYGGKVRKISIDAGFTCPNRDGAKGVGGCIYCDVNSFVHVPKGEIARQVGIQIEKLNNRGVDKFTLYFQSYSNTYGKIEDIVAKIDEALIDDRIVEIAIGTRPDVVENQKLEEIKRRYSDYDVVFELGLQSIHNTTLNLINRGHTFEDFDDAVNRVKSFGFKVCAHVILGLPFETKQMMLETVKYLSDKKVDFVKFHHLHVLKGTKLENMFVDKKFKLLGEDEYIEILSDAIKILDRDIVISRLVGDSPKEITVAPNWPESKLIFLNKLNNYLETNDIYQGKGD